MNVNLFLGRRRNIGRRERPIVVPVRPELDAAEDEDRGTRGVGNVINQGTLTEGEGSVQLTSSFR
jgi:hypothetical protein